MARGFWMGLGHGAMLGAGILTILALAVPVATPPEAVLSRGKAEGPGQSEPAATSGQGVAPTAEDAPHAAPSAAVVDVPVGSGFGRAEDLSPIPPSPLQPAPPPVAPAAAPVATAAGTEPPPAPARLESNRPDPVPPLRDEAAPVAPEIVEGADIVTPNALSAPDAVVAPGFAQTAVADGLPALEGVSPDQSLRLPLSGKAPAPGPDANAAIAGGSAVGAGGSGASFTATGPGPQSAQTPDLSLPPDLSEIRRSGAN